MARSSASSWQISLTQAYSYKTISETQTPLDRGIYHRPEAPSSGINEVPEERSTITSTRGYCYHTHEVARLVDDMVLARSIT
jgi:hypothetical protein